MELFSVVITGSNRGIGLEFVRQLANSTKPPRHIFATYRRTNTLQKLEDVQKFAPSAVQIHLVKLDVRNGSDVDNLRRFVEDVVGKKGLTLLINNAGIVQPQPFPGVTFENWNVHFQVNAVGPVLLAQAFLPALKKAASSESSPGMRFSKAGILNVSSVAGSIAKAGVHTKLDLGAPSYKTSKAALNMAMRIMAATRRDDNILIVNMCPGWVKTDMGAARANISPEESVAAMLNTITKLNESNHGTYVDRFGDPIPW